MLILQLIVATIGVGLFYLFFSVFSKASIESAILIRKEQATAEIGRRQEEWRTWKALGLNDALNEELNDFRSRLKLSELEVIPAAMASDKESIEDIILPRELTDGVNFLVSARIDTKAFSRWSKYNDWIIYLLILLACCFVMTVTVSSYFIINKIYAPVSQLLLAMQESESAEGLKVSHIRAMGEIKEFIVRTKKVHDDASQYKMLAGISQMAQMIVHDLRRPFSMVRALFRSVQNEKDIATLKRLMDDTLPEFEDAANSIDSMINDLLSLGSAESLVLEPSSALLLAKEAVSELGRTSRKQGFVVHLNASSVHMINADKLKIKRCISNILENAMQVNESSVEVWLDIHQTKNELRIDIENDGPVISRGLREKIFDAFYTSKSHGTGLGLTITKSIVEIHGGSIACIMSDRRQTMFRMSFPITSDPDVHTPFVMDIDRQGASPIGEVVVAGTNQTIQRLSKMLLARDISLQVLLVEDDQVYVRAFEALVGSLCQDSKRVRVTTARTDYDALEVMRETKFDLIVCDISLKAKQDGGFRVLEHAKKFQSKAMLCVHSNLPMAQIQPRADLLGVDAFVDKPMTAKRLLEIFETVCSRNHNDVILNGKNVLFIDDNIYALQDWRRHWPELSFTYLAPSHQLAADVAALPAVFDFALVDLRFGEGLTIDGFDAAKYIKGHLGIPVVLMTNADVRSLSPDTRFVDAMIGKDPIELISIGSLLGIASLTSTKV